MGGDGTAPYPEGGWSHDYIYTNVHIHICIYLSKHVELFMKKVNFTICKLYLNKQTKYKYAHIHTLICWTRKSLKSLSVLIFPDSLLRVWSWSCRAAGIESRALFHF